MAITKITNEQLTREIESGMSVKMITEKYGLHPNTVYMKMKKLGLKSKNWKMESAADCFAYDRRMKRCDCLTSKTCQGRGCPFYKELGQALEEMKRGIGRNEFYDIQTQKIMAQMNTKGKGKGYEN